MLEMIMRSSERAADLTQQLLAYAGKVQIILEPADISRIAREACEQVRAGLPKNIHLTIKSGSSIPLIETHVGNMRQVIVNLVMNGVEAIGEAAGVVTVRTGIQIVTQGGSQSNVLGYELAAGRYVLVEVSDSGPGMNEHIQTQMFDPFFTTKFTGRGLGLAVVQGVVRSLGGAICVSSEAGRGTTFSVLLPLRAAVEDASGLEVALDRVEVDGPPA
jgi:signal transduction histidine kinase